MDGAPSNPAAPPLAEIRCPGCGTSMPASAGFCPGCGRALKSLPLRDRLAAAAGYCTPLPAAVLLLLPAYRKNQFVRFHAWQSVLFWGVVLFASVIAILCSNFLGAIVLLLAGVLASLAMFFLWIVLVVKAGLGERFELPFLGPLAGRLR